jgi:hypothetical protein
VITDIVRQLIYRITRKHGKGELIEEYEAEFKKPKSEKSKRSRKVKG